MKYKNLIFDLYGTLVDIHTETEGEMLWEKTALYFSFYGAHYSGLECCSGLSDPFYRLYQTVSGSEGSAGKITRRGTCTLAFEQCAACFHPI